MLASSIWTAFQSLSNVTGAPKMRSYSPRYGGAACVTCTAFATLITPTRRGPQIMRANVDSASSKKSLGLRRVVGGLHPPQPQRFLRTHRIDIRAHDLRTAPRRRDERCESGACHACGAAIPRRV